MQSQRLQKILKLSLPIIAGMLSQSLFNLVDAAMVGQLGDQALAGVGLGSYANFVIIALVAGFSSAVQAQVARRRGAGQLASCAEPVNAGLFAAIGLVLPFSLLLVPLGRPLMSLLSHDPTVVQIGTEYFHYRVLALAAVAMNLSFRGYWNGTRRATHFLLILMVMHGLNIIISYILIFGAFGIPAMGAPGSAMGTLIAMYIGSLLYGVMTYRGAKNQGFLFRLPWRCTWISLYRLALPNSLQQLIFALGFLLLFWIIAKIGTEEVAVAHILVNLSLLLILPGVGLGMAATTLVSHSLGAQDAQEAYLWGWDVVKLAGIILFLLGIPLWLFPETILQIFVHDPRLWAIGTWPLRIQGIGLCLDAAGIVLTQALLGAGANRAVMKVNIATQWFFYLPMAWLIGPVAGFGLTGIWFLQMLQRSLNSVILLRIWIKRRWVHITI